MAGLTLGGSADSWLQVFTVFKAVLIDTFITKPTVACSDEPAETPRRYGAF